jgi:hypothetical protein
MCAATGGEPPPVKIFQRDALRGAEISRLAGSVSPDCATAAGDSCAGVELGAGAELGTELGAHLLLGAEADLGLCAAAALDGASGRTAPVAGCFGSARSRAISRS